MKPHIVLKEHHKATENTKKAVERLEGMVGTENSGLIKQRLKNAGGYLTSALASVNKMMKEY